MAHPFLTRVQRQSFLGVPVDHVAPEDWPSVVEEMIGKNEARGVAFLGFPEFRKARRDSEYLAYLQGQSLVLLKSRRIEKAMKFLKMDPVQRYNDFDSVIQILGHLEPLSRSLYVLGGKHQEVQKVAGNLRASFPSVSLVGRHGGFFRKEREEEIRQAINKAAPTFFFLGTGVPQGAKWVYRQKGNLRCDFFIHSPESFRIMTGRALRITEESFQRGSFERRWYHWTPLGLPRWLSGVAFGAVLLVHRLRKIH